MTEVTIPTDLWDACEGVISGWLYSDGDSVEAGTVIAELMVEKVSFELLAPMTGKLNILVAAENSVAAGQVVAHIIP